MKKVQKPKKPLIFYYIIAIIVILLLNSVIFPKFMKQSVKTVDYGTFLMMVDKKEVKRFRLRMTAFILQIRKKSLIIMRPQHLMILIWSTGCMIRAVPLAG